MTKLALLVAAALAPASTNAFAPGASIVPSKSAFVSQQPLFAEVENKAEESAFVPLETEAVDEDATFAKAESLGRGAAKASSVKLTSQKKRFIFEELIMRFFSTHILVSI